MRLILGFAAIVVMAFALNVQAQERTAGGAVENQMTWSALSSQIGAVKTYSEAVNSRIDQSIVCSKKGLLYAPGGTGVDADGCKLADNTAVVNLTNLVTTMNACSAQGTFYNPTTRACVAGNSGLRWAWGGVGVPSKSNGYTVAGAYAQMGAPLCSTSQMLSNPCTSKGARCYVIDASHQETCGTTGGSERPCTKIDAHHFNICN